MIQSTRFTVRKTKRFDQWLQKLRDTQTRAHILARLTRLESGQVGDARGVGGGVSELRIHIGAGYRVYFTRIGARVVFLLAGGDKSTQTRDIAQAQAFAASLHDEGHDEN
jgi:putative addiction module killer protein